MQKYLDIFLKSTPVLIGKLNNALLRNDLVEIASQVHGYKTEMIMMGMNDAKELAVTIEVQCGDGNNTGQLKDNVVKLVQQIETAIIELQSA
jgi:HPt (histidine-containing phosphotransfer) domain-containing protein